MEFKELKKTQHLRLCTVSKFIGLDDKTHEIIVQHEDPNDCLAIEYKDSETTYLVVAFIDMKTGKLTDVDNRYFDYIRENHLEYEFNRLVEAADRIKHKKYIPTPEEAAEAIEEYIKSLDV